MGKVENLEDYKKIRELIKNCKTRRDVSDLYTKMLELGVPKATAIKYMNEAHDVLRQNLNPPKIDNEPKEEKKLGTIVIKL